ncbi:hypothetical protein [Roseomonas mucosa]|nr:hypothetical protein [Roseomonas mucosa]
MIAPTYAERALAYVATGSLPPLPTLSDGATAVATWVALIIVFLSPVRIR